MNNWRPRPVVAALRPGIVTTRDAPRRTLTRAGVNARCSASPLTRAVVFDLSSGRCGVGPAASGLRLTIAGLLRAIAMLVVQRVAR